MAIVEATPPKHRKPAGTIDLTPTWRSILRYLIVGLTDGNATGVKIATEELERMADLADERNRLVHAPLNWRPVSEYVNVGTRSWMLDEPVILLWSEQTGPTTGKLMRVGDDQVVDSLTADDHTVVTHFATFNTPDLS